MRLLKCKCILGMAFAFAIAGNARAQSSGTDVPNVRDARSLIHIGDLVDVDVIGSTEFDWRGEVTPEGVLGVNFTEEPVFARCKDPQDIADVVAASYGRFLNRPEVRVEILDKSKRPMAVLLGAVRQPHRFSLKGDLTLQEMIVLAGGISENASGEIEIFRTPASNCSLMPDKAGSADSTDHRQYVPGSTFKLDVSIPSLLSGDPDSNPLIQYGDLVTVKRALPVYVIGSVARPGIVPISPGLSVQRAIDAAGGFLEEKRIPIIRVFRNNGKGVTIIEVGDPEQETSGTRDLQLNEYDIVEVFGDKKNQLKYPPVLREFDKIELAVDELPIRIVNDRKN